MGREVCPQSQAQIQPYENEAGASKRKLPERGPQFNRHLIHTGEGTFAPATWLHTNYSQPCYETLLVVVVSSRGEASS